MTSNANILFWQLEAPEYDSDYQDKYINGILDHPFTLPSIKCSSCGESWGTSRFLPYRCPRSIENVLLQSQSHPVAVEIFKKIKSNILSEFKTQGLSVSELQPGDALQPSYLDIPSGPVVDFLWASLGSLVVSKRVKDLLEEHCISDIVCCPITLRKIGKCGYDVRIPIPDSGEPEDIIKNIELDYHSEVSPYYEVCLNRQSKLPHGVILKSTCSTCGRNEYDDIKRQISMADDMWDGSKIFHLATTLRVIVTDEIKICIEELKPTNVRFSRI